jgi:hypothetical protein
MNKDERDCALAGVAALAVLILSMVIIRLMPEARAYYLASFGVVVLFVGAVVLISMWLNR